MKPMIIILTAILLTGCHYFKSNETLLTENNWILSDRIINSIRGGVPKSEYYKKSEMESTLKFNKDGTFHISENGHGFDYLWSINNDEVLLSMGNKSLDVHISEITSDKMEISYIKDDKFYYETYLTSDNSEWRTDAFIDSYRGTFNVK